MCHFEKFEIFPFYMGFDDRANVYYEKIVLEWISAEKMTQTGN